MSEASRMNDTGGLEGAWDDLPVDPPAVPLAVGSRARPAWFTAVAAVLVLNGISLSLYLGSLGAAPAWAPDPLPAIGAVTGVAAFAAAVGVFRQQAWGRWLGIALVVGWLARDAALLEGWISTGYVGLERSSPNVLLDIVLPIAVNLIVLWLLVRRWPAPSQTDAGTSA